MNEFFLIAKVSSIYGEDGFVKLVSYSDFPERFSNLKKVYVDFFGSKKELEVEKVEKKRNFFILKFRNFNSDKEVSLFLNKEILVNEADLVKLPEDYFFIHDLINSRVFQNSTELGVIIDVQTLPGNDLYVVKGVTGNELLIPAVKAFIERFDSDKKELYLKPEAVFLDNNEN